MVRDPSPAWRDQDDKSEQRARDSISAFQFFSFSVFRRRQLQIDGVQFPTQTIAAEAQLDVFVINSEIARTGEERVPELRPIDRLAGSVEARNRRNRVGVAERIWVGDQRGQT